MKAPRKKPVGLDMPFHEARAQFIGLSPEEFAANVAAAKERRGPPEQSPPAKMDDKPQKRLAKPQD